MTLGVPGDADQPGALRVVDHQRQQLEGRRVLTNRVLDVPADQEQVVHLGVGETG
jgi:hypothetical protein